MKIWINGGLVEKEDATVSVFDHGVLYGDGVFEGIRSYGGRIFQCGAHLDRLAQSAEALRLKMSYSKNELERGMYDAMAANGVVDGYIRLVITRGPGTLGLNPFLCTDSVTFIIADQIAMYSEDMYRDGIAVIISKTRRVHSSMMNLRAKSCNYLNNIYAKMECVEAGVPEALMLNADGCVAEATGDNIFIVREGTLVTPPPEAGILLGVTRGVVMHLARESGIAVLEETIYPDDVYTADECFLTGTGAEVIAVTGVDGRSIGEGGVGPVTEKLLERFRAFVETGQDIPYET